MFYLSLIFQCCTAFIARCKNFQFGKNAAFGNDFGFFYKHTTSTNDVYLGKYRHRKDWANTHFAFRCSNAPNYAITTVSNTLPVHHSYGEWACFLYDWSSVHATADAHSLTERPDRAHINAPNAPSSVWQTPCFGVKTALQHTNSTFFAP
jgi:hypothetical protein